MNERLTKNGFTLIELLVILAIASLVTGLLVAILYQFWTIPRWGNAQLALDHDIRNAGLWLMQDGNESASFTPGTCTFDTNRVVYALNGTDLERTESGQTTAVARYVSGLNCALSGSQAVVTLNLAKDTVSTSTTITVTMREN